MGGHDELTYSSADAVAKGGVEAYPVETRQGAQGEGGGVAGLKEGTNECFHI